VGTGLRAGAVVALYGPLGSGKSVFSRGVAQALGVKAPVTSPTFTIVNEYESSPPLLHIDLYRIRDGEEFALLGVAERFARSITLIEWPEHAQDELPELSYTVELSLTGEHARSIRIDPDPEISL